MGWDGTVVDEMWCDKKNEVEMLSQVEKVNELCVLGRKDQKNREKYSGSPQRKGKTRDAMRGVTNGSLSASSQLVPKIRRKWNRKRTLSGSEEWNKTKQPFEMFEMANWADNEAVAESEFHWRKQR